jgi:hypothetical protein
MTPCGYRNNLLKDENDDLLADSHIILNIWKNFLYQLLNIHGVIDVRRIEMHTAEPLVPDPSSFEDEIAIAKFRRYKSPGRDQIPVEHAQRRGEILRPNIHKLITYFWEKLTDQWYEFIVVSLHKKDDKLNVVIIEGYHYNQLHSKFYPIFLSQG